jgi:hypothetical protein
MSLCGQNLLLLNNSNKIDITTIGGSPLEDFDVRFTLPDLVPCA